MPRDLTQPDEFLIRNPGRSLIAAAIWRIDMHRVAKILSGAIVFTGLNMGASAHDEHHHETTEGRAITIQGELVDTACFVGSDGEEKGADHEKCAAKCMKSGIPAGILPEGKKADDVLFLLTNPVVLAPYAAQTIKVEGTAYADKHAIEVKKLYVKDGNSWKEVQLADAHHKPASADTPHDEHKGHHGDHDPDTK